MNRLVPRLLAFVALLAVIGVTFSALRDSSRWRSSKHKLKPVAEDPYRNLATMLGPSNDSTGVAPRNPFVYAEVHAAAVPRRAVAPPKVVAAAPEMPVLTAIIVETGNTNPKAVISYGGRSYTVGPGDLFLDYRVISVTPDQVVIDNNGQQMVLKPHQKGD